MMQPILQHFNFIKSTAKLLDMSSYKVTVLFFEKFKDKNEFFNAIGEYLDNINHSSKKTIELFFKFLIYSKNIILEADYRILFI